MVAQVNTVAFQGIDVQTVEVQVQISKGLPGFTIVGLPDKAVAESKERVRAALHALGLSLPPKRLTVNLAPADLSKEGSHFDLPIALAVLAAMEVIPKEKLLNTTVMGELSLDASIRPVAGILPAAMHAGANDNALICPEASGGEAAWAGDLSIMAPKNLMEIINHIKGTQSLKKPQAQLQDEHGKKPTDFADIKGQESAKRAAEVAAAGGHNMLMVGPPGSGKSMLASAIPGILPPLSAREALEISMIHSLAGSLPEGGLLQTRPYRDPHHSASLPALIGGGQKVKPGEISLAHNGVLFLDELPEFARSTLEALRQPLESRQALIARANQHVRYPAKFQLIAAMNPCRCGHFGDNDLACNKAPRCAGDYQAKISGPMMDRIDLQVEMPAISIADLNTTVTSESSETIAARVAAAQEIQNERFRSIGAEEHITLNAHAEGQVLEAITVMEDNAKDMLTTAAETAKLSARGYFRTLRTARTLADMDSVREGRIIEHITKKHIAEALSYRRHSFS
jgi:magnesium chelatase family protein